MRTLLFVILGCIGCTRSINDKGLAEEAWDAGLTAEQVAAVQADKVACSEMYQKLLDAAASSAPGTLERLGLLRLEAHHDEYLSEVRAGNHKTAALYFRQLIEGKSLIDLAWEQSAEVTKIGR